VSTPERPSPNRSDDDRGLSGLQRALLALAGLAALLLAFVIFQAAGDEGGGSASEGTTAAQTATAPADTTTTETGTTTTETGATGADGETGTTGETGTATGETETETETGTTQTQPTAPTVPTIRVVDGRPQGGVRTLSFETGERIRFRVRSDAADEVHVHGYDVTKAVPAGGSALLSFEATIEGRFEVELHEAGSQIAELEVAPS
jgi:hypothetical protein